METTNLPLLELVLRSYQNFNARATKDALLAYWRHLEGGGKMFWAMAGAMSSAQLGISLAPAIREGLIHGFSVTGANLEESLFRLVAHRGYKDFPDYRYFTKRDDTRILEDRMRRVTDTSIPEDEAFRAVEQFIVPMWKRAGAEGTRRFGTSTSRVDPNPTVRTCTRERPTSAGCSPPPRRSSPWWSRGTRIRPSGISSPLM